MGVSVTITNTGTGEVTLSRPTPVKYNVMGANSAPILAKRILIPAGESVKLTVLPKTGLTVGQHDETITFTTNEGATASIRATFTVTEALVDQGTDGQLTWKLYDDGTLSITGTGAMRDYPEDAPWDKYTEVIEKIVIGSGVTTIGNFAFSNCDALESVTFGSGVKTIGEMAFYDCGALETITIPNSVTVIKKAAFRYCTALKNVTIGSGVQTIGEMAFSACDLESVTIGSGVKTIENYAFSDGFDLVNVTCLATTPPTLGDSNFKKNTADVLRVPSGSLASYGASAAWSDAFKSIEAIQ
jgi:hypothetical protein